MANYNHSVSLDAAKCKGCTNCLKRCPTEAIRIRDARAVINPSRCIDCGECIRVCPYQAKKAVYEKMSAMDRFKYKIALPSPTLYGQFNALDEIDYVLQGLLDCGFDDVYEVSRAAELVSGYTRRYLRRSNIKKPVISSACPAITRLISLRFPYLCDNILPILQPMELAGKLAREDALRKHPELRPEDIGVCFISPCPARVSAVKNSENSYVDCVVSMSDVYFALLPVMKKEAPPVPMSRSGVVGIGWAATGGEAAALFNDHYLAADGIENVIRVLDELDNGSYPDLEFVELNACNGGCVGGAMAVVNPYIAKARLQTLRRYLPVSQNWDFGDGGQAADYIPEDCMSPDSVVYTPAANLDSDMKEAFRKMADIQKIHAVLPDKDCGSCGAPTCSAFAADVVNGEAKMDECVVLMRAKLARLLQAKRQNAAVAAAAKKPKNENNDENKTEA